MPKVAAKKAKTTKKTTATKTKKVAVKRITAISDPFTKTQTFGQIAEKTELTRKQIQSVFDELANVIEGHIKKRSAGEFTLPGLLKIQVKEKPATKARKGINPFTGEEIMIKAKPKRRTVKVKALKKLKEMAE